MSLISYDVRIKLLKQIAALPFETRSLSVVLLDCLNKEEFDKMKACVIGAQHMLEVYSDDETIFGPLRKMRGLLII